MADTIHVVPASSLSESAKKALVDVVFLQGEFIGVAESYDRAMRLLIEIGQLFNQFCWCHQELLRLILCDCGDWLTKDSLSNDFDARVVANSAFENIFLLLAAF